MAPKTSQAKEHARLQLRDEHGHFIKSAKVNIRTSAVTPFDPAGPVGTGGRERSRIDEFEKPLLQVSITNPFRKILYWLDQIRRHQTTTFAIKLSIPLIALPVVIAGVFSLGRIYGINFQKSQASPLPSPTTRYQIPDTFLSRAGTLKIAVGDTTRYLLSLKNGELVVLEIPPTINLSKYQNKQVLVTGTYNKTANILKVSDIAEIEIFNTTAVASSSAN